LSHCVRLANSFDSLKKSLEPRPTKKDLKEFKVMISYNHKVCARSVPAGIMSMISSLRVDGWVAQGYCPPNCCQAAGQTGRAGSGVDRQGQDGGRRWVYLGTCLNVFDSFCYC